MAQTLLYRGTIVDVADPTSRGRVQVTTPAVSGVPSWAIVYASASRTAAATPVPGETVLVTYEGGNRERAIALPLISGQYASGLPIYRSVVTDNVDPEGNGRLKVMVPDLDCAETWAWRCTPVASGALAVGASIGVALQKGNSSGATVLGEFD